MVVLRNSKNTQEHQVAFAQAKQAKAKANAEAMAKAEMQKNLDNKTKKILYQWNYGTGSMPTMAELAVLIQCYSDAGLLVPDCLTESLCYMLKGLNTTRFVQHIPVFEDDDADYSYKPWI